MTLIFLFGCNFLDLMKSSALQNTEEFARNFATPLATFDGPAVTTTVSFLFISDYD